MKTKIQRIQRGNYRFYKVNGVDYPSVTSVLSLLPKPGIIFWSVYQTIRFIQEKGNLDKKTTSLAYGYHKRLLAELASTGTDNHQEVEDYVLKGEDSNSSVIKRYKEFENETGFICDKAEEIVWNDKLKIAGTLDLFGCCNNLPIVLDLKTSKVIRLSHKIQSVVYKYMYCKLNKLDYKNVKSGVLLLPRNKPRKWNLYINSLKEEKVYLKIFVLLRKLFYFLLQLNELDFN